MIHEICNWFFIVDTCIVKTFYIAADAHGRFSTHADHIHKTIKIIWIGYIGAIHNDTIKLRQIRQ